MNENINKKLSNFIKTWSDHGNEVADKVTYWNTLLELLGVPENKIDDNSFIKYEKPIKVTPADRRDKFHGSIDCYIPSTKVLIEQKSFGVNLFKKELRKNGNDSTPITPFQQADRYNQHLPQEEKARYYVLCNFYQIVIYDVRKSLNEKPQIIELKDLKKQLYLLKFLVDEEAPHLEKEEEISLGAGELVGKLYDELRKQYADPDSEKAKKSINALCVRLVFCLYAEDAGLFDKEQFHDYLINKKPHEIRLALVNLFKMLDTNDKPESVRKKKFGEYYQDDDPELARFPYVNGGMFSDENIEIPPFTQELKDVLLVDASEHFDWSDISPTIFGAIFESTLNPETRRQEGMHYTSVQNIHRIIDPLFLDDLKTRLNKIEEKYNQARKLTKRQQKSLEKDVSDFQKYLKSLTFLDPACGSGNFLTETYLSLRKLENRAISLETGGQTFIETGKVAKEYIQVSIQQFYGIEINDFAVSVAKTALWIAEDKMMKETQNLISGADWEFLPLKTYTNIHEGNALRLDWNRVINADPTKPNKKVSYIISNPPFAGYTYQNKNQKEDLKSLFGKTKNIDYVACWYYKAAQYIQGSSTKVAFVSTNSITQGQQVYPIWHILIDHFKVHINFAYRSFAWNSEARHKAHVHVVIIGFSRFDDPSKKIFADKKIIQAQNINPYLLAAPNVMVKERRTPICNVPKMIYGSKSTDGGNLILTEKEKNVLLAKEPQVTPFVKKYMGSGELIKGKTRYCLWLNNCSPAELKTMPLVLKRIEKVRIFRQNSKKKATQKWADQPALFIENRQPNSNYLMVPIVSSEKRAYVPMGYISKDVIANTSAQLVPSDDLYYFGVLESRVHMGWMRTVAGRLETRYSYHNTVVYNTFPWPNPTPVQRKKIAETAQGILDAREPYLHPMDGSKPSSLADLYGPNTMPPKLLEAHQSNDKAVMQAYGFQANMTEPEIVGELFKMYEKLIKQQKAKKDNLI